MDMIVCIETKTLLKIHVLKERLAIIESEIKRKLQFIKLDHRLNRAIHQSPLLQTEPSPPQMEMLN